MATHRVKKSGKEPPPFTRIDNSMLHDERLNFKARSLLAYMLSKPEHFRFYLDEQIKHTTEKKDSIRTGMKELEQLGYVHRYPVKNERGKIMSWELDIYESPSLCPESGFPVVENPTLVTNEYILTNDIRFNKDIDFEDIRNQYFQTYLKHFALNKKKQHVRITVEQYQSIGEQIEQLQSFGATAEEWETEVMEHSKSCQRATMGISSLSCMQHQGELLHTFGTLLPGVVVCYRPNQTFIRNKSTCRLIELGLTGTINTVMLVCGARPYSSRQGRNPKCRNATLHK